jgi:hypothetical protein
MDLLVIILVTPVVVILCLFGSAILIGTFEFLAALPETFVDWREARRTRRAQALLLSRRAVRSTAEGGQQAANDPSAKQRIKYYKTIRRASPAKIIAFAALLLPQSHSERYSEEWRDWLHGMTLDGDPWIRRAWYVIDVLFRAVPILAIRLRLDQSESGSLTSEVNAD